MEFDAPMKSKMRPKRIHMLDHVDRDPAPRRAMRESPFVDHPSHDSPKAMTMRELPTTRLALDWDVSHIEHEVETRSQDILKRWNASKRDQTCRSSCPLVCDSTASAVCSFHHGPPLY